MNNARLRLRLRGLHNSDAGQALVLVAVGLMMLMLVAALGVDVGWLHYQKEQMQKAADSAALAAAEALKNGDSTWQEAGYSDANINGFANNQSGINVAINNPPTTAGDPFVGNSNYVEVIVSQSRPTFFMKVAGLNFTSLPVSSRAVASLSASASGCIIALDSNDDPKTLLLNGNVNVNSTCGVYDNSSASNALVINGASGSLSAGGAGIGVVGGWSGSGFTPMPVTLTAPIPDPFASVPEPVPTSCSQSQSLLHITSNTTIQPGVYCGGIVVTSGTTVTFGKAGVYTMCGGGLSITGQANLIGTGVTIYNTGNVAGVCKQGNQFAPAPISIAGGATTNLSAPTTGTYAGILIFQDRSYMSTKNVDASSVDGSAGATFTGALYFPGTDLTYAGNPNATVSSLLIAYQITISGNTSINNNLLVNGWSPAQTAALAE